MAQTVRCIVILLYSLCPYTTLSALQFCVPIGERQGIDIYEWKTIESGTCNLLLHNPFIIQNSVIKQWGKSQRKEILNIFKNFEIPFVHQSTFCDCFPNQNNTDLCPYYANSFAYHSPKMMSFLNMNSREESIWYNYQSNHYANTHYSKCVIRSTTYISVEQALNKLKSFAKQNKTSNDALQAIHIAFGLELDGEQRTHFNRILKYSNLSPYFKPFQPILKSFLDIEMLNIWIGSTNQITAVHFDKTDIIYFLFDGNKTFLLSPPELADIFTLYPFLDIDRRFAVNDIDLVSKFKYRVNIYKNEVFFLPAFWYHQAINGPYNTFAINLWTDRTALRNIITSHQFSSDIKGILLNVNSNNWKYIVFHFVHKLLHKYDMFSLMKYFGKLYPILNEMQQYHLMLSTLHVEYNTEWLFWFMDFENMLKCYGDDEYHGELLNDILNKRDNAMLCPSVNGDELSRVNEWKNEINEILNKIKIISSIRGNQVAQIELAEFVEKIIFMITDDIMFNPIVIALYFL